MKTLPVPNAEEFRRCQWGRKRSDRLMVVPQREIGEDTLHIREDAPRTWAYLSANGGRLDGRGSVIYRGKPRFSIFGVGTYTFAPWKVAISGFYKAMRFVKVGPVIENPWCSMTQCTSSLAGRRRRRILSIPLSSLCPTLGYSLP